MATPSQVRSGLQVVTEAAQADVRAVATAAGQDPSTVRASLFAATPLIVSEYAEGSSALALDWFEEIRADSGARSLFSPQPLVLVTDDAVTTAVAVATQSLYEIEQGVRRELNEALEESLRLIEAEVQKEVASGFWDTMTGNAHQDPDAVGWQRFAKPGACKFCSMLAGKGAVYTEYTANFAAHTNCHCVAGPAFDPTAPRATAIQYVASKKRRTAAESAALRQYLNENYPDAPG